MSSDVFDRDATASWYAHEHLDIDPGVRSIYYLPEGAPDREIRFVEINHLIAEMNVSSLQPLDFGVDTGSGSEHKLYVLDVTPNQWEMIEESTLPLPPGWTLKNAQVFSEIKPRT